MLARIFLALALLAAGAAHAQTNIIGGGVFGDVKVASGGSPWTLIAHTSATGQGTTVTTSAINTTGAKLILVHVFIYAQNSVGITVGDNKSNTPSSLQQQPPTIAGATCFDQIFYFISPTVGTGHTFTLTGLTGLFGGVEIQAWGDTSGTPAYDTPNQNGTNSNTALNPIQPGSITPSVSNALVAAGACFANDTPVSTYTVNSPFTVSDFNPYSASSPTAEGGVFAYSVQTTATAANPTFTDSTANSAASAVIASFKP